MCLGLLGWEENGRWRKIGREKRAKENIFPCLLGEKMGEERKWGRKIVWAPCPIFPPTFPPKMGGFWDKFFLPLSALHSLVLLPSIVLHNKKTPFLIYSPTQHAKLKLIQISSKYTIFPFLYFLQVNSYIGVFIRMRGLDKIGVSREESKLRTNWVIYLLQKASLNQNRGFMGRKSRTRETMLFNKINEYPMCLLVRTCSISWLFFSNVYKQEIHLLYIRWMFILELL